MFNILESGSLVSYSIEDVIKFFKEVILKIQKQDMNDQAFKCFKSLFLIVNLKSNKMYHVEKGSNFRRNFQNRLHNQWNNNNHTPQFDYSFLVPPQELIGLNDLWEMVYVMHSDKVAKQASDFLVQIYSGMNMDLAS